MIDWNEHRRVFKEAGIPEQEIEDFIFNAQALLALGKYGPIYSSKFSCWICICTPILVFLAIFGVLLFTK